MNHKNQKSQDLYADSEYSMIDVEGDAKWNVLLMENPLAKELSGIA